MVYCFAAPNPSLMVMLLLLALAHPTMSYKGNKVGDGLLMLYEFSENEDAGPGCDDRSVPDAHQGGTGFGPLTLSTAERVAEGCKSEFSTDNTGVSVWPEGARGSNRWRMRSNRTVRDMWAWGNVTGSDPLSFGFSIELWLKLTYEDAPYHVMGLMLPTIDTPGIHDEQFRSDPLFQEDFLESSVFSSCDITTKLEHVQHLPYVLGISVEGGAISFYYRARNDQCVYLSNPTGIREVGETRLVHYVLTVETSQSSPGHMTVSSALSGQGDPVFMRSTMAPGFPAAEGHFWNPEAHLEFGHQFRDTGAPFEILQYSMYDRPLSESEILSNYMAFIQDSPSVANSAGTTLEEDGCGLVVLTSRDFDNESMRAWSEYHWPGSPEARLSEMDGPASYTVTGVPHRGSLFADPLCPESSRHSSAPFTVFPYDALYFRPAEDEYGHDYTQFSFRAVGSTPRCRDSMMTIEVVSVPDLTIAAPSTSNATRGVCSRVQMLATDADSDRGIRSFSILTLPKKGMLFRDDLCTLACGPPEEGGLLDGSTGSATVWYRSSEQAGQVASIEYGADAFEHSVAGPQGEVDPRAATNTINLINSIQYAGAREALLTEDAPGRLILNWTDALSPDPVMPIDIIVTVLPMMGTVRHILSGLVVAAGLPLESSDLCSSGEALVPCISYEPPADATGTHVDSVTVACVKADGRQSEPTLVYISLHRVPDPPILLCPTNLPGPLAAAEPGVELQVSISVMDPDLSESDGPYVMSVESDGMSFALPHASSLKLCFTRDSCCSADCEVYVETNNLIHQGTALPFSRQTTIVGNLRTIQTAISVVTCRGGDASDGGPSILSISIEDPHGLKTSCSVEGNTSEFTLDAGKSQRTLGVDIIPPLLLASLFGSMVVPWAVSRLMSSRSIGESTTAGISEEAGVGV